MVVVFTVPVFRLYVRMTQLNRAASPPA